MAFGTGCFTQGGARRASLRFASTSAEDGYVNHLSHALAKNFRIMCFVIVFACIIAVVMGMTISSPREPPERILAFAPQIIFFGVVGLLWSSSWVVNHISAWVRECFCMWAVMLQMIMTVLIQPHYERAIFGSSVGSFNGESDSHLLLCLVSGIVAAHMLLPIRWFLLVPLQVFCIMVYVSCAYVVGSPEVAPQVNLLLLVLVVFLLSVGKHTVEIEGRQAFKNVAAARTRLAEVEFRVAQLQSQASSGGPLEITQDKDYQSQYPSSLAISDSAFEGPINSAEKHTKALDTSFAEQSTQTVEADFRNIEPRNVDTLGRVHQLRKPPRQPCTFDADDDARSVDSRDTALLEATLPTQKLMANSVSPTTLQSCCRSVRQNMKHWNLGYDSSSCCPFHAALRVTGIAFRKLSKEKCNPLWSPFLDWSCDTCTSANHKSVLHCAVCGQLRPVPVKEGMPEAEHLQVTLDAYTGRVITCSPSFAGAFGELPRGFIFFTMFKKDQPFWSHYQHEVALFQERMDHEEIEAAEAAAAAAELWDCSDSEPKVMTNSSSFTDYLQLVTPSLGFESIVYEAACTTTLSACAIGTASEGLTENRSIVAHIAMAGMQLSKHVYPHRKNIMTL